MLRPGRQRFAGCSIGGVHFPPPFPALTRGRLDGDVASRHALAHVVVCLSHQVDLHAPHHEAGKGLARRALQVEREAPGEAGVAVQLRHGAAHAAQG